MHVISRFINPRWYCYLKRIYKLYLTLHIRLLKGALSNSKQLIFAEGKPKNVSMIMTKSLKLSFTDITSLDLIAIPVSFNSFVIYANVFRSFRRTHKIKKANSQVSFPLFLFKCPTFLIAPAALSLCVMLTQSVLSGIWKENFSLPNPWFYPPLYPRAWVQSLWIPELFCITWTMVAF